LLLHYSIFGVAEQNDCNVMLYLTTKHDFENFGGQLAGCPPGCGPVSSVSRGPVSQCFQCTWPIYLWHTHDKFKV